MMIVHQLSVESVFTDDEKMEKINNSEVGDLLKVVREYEDNPSFYDEKIMKAVCRRLFDKGIMCI